MYLIIKEKSIRLRDGKKAKFNNDGTPRILMPSETITPGTYPLESIPNPLKYKGSWLVLAGTEIGMSENGLRHLCEQLPEYLEITE